MPRPRNTPDLLRGDRNRDILEHVARYRLTTPPVLFNLFFEATLADDNAVTKVTSRLVERDFLRKFNLHGSYKYFTLGKRGAKTVGVKPKLVGKPLGSQALFRDYGTLRFCSARPTERELLKFSEINARYPELKHRKLDFKHYYLDQSGAEAELGYIWIDGGGDEAHIARKMQQDIIAPRLQVPGLREHIQQGRFTFAIVTLSDEKKLQILDALDQLRFVDPIIFRVEVVPELLPLLPSRA